MDREVVMYELSVQTFHGKDDLFKIIQDNEVGEIEVKSSNRDNLVEKYRRFLSNVKQDTEHKKYLKTEIQNLLDVVLSSSSDEYSLINMYIKPYYIYTIFRNELTNEIISAIKGYDIQKMTEDEWGSLWGNKE